MAPLLRPAAHHGAQTMAELRALDDGAGEKEGRRRLGDGPRAGDDAPWGADMDLGSSSEVAPLTVGY